MLARGGNCFHLTWEGGWVEQLLGPSESRRRTASGGFWLEKDPTIARTAVK